MPDAGAQCEQMAKDLRRVPKEMRRALNKELKDTVAAPLATRINARIIGHPWGRVLATAKPLAGTEIKIKVGGTKTPKLSGGANPLTLVRGTEFSKGRGNTTTRVARSAKHAGYRRRTSIQFIRHRKAYIYPTIGREMPKILEGFADAVVKVVGEELG